MSTPAPRSERLRRVRRRVAGGAVALFAASIGAIVLAGHQPASKPTTRVAAAPAPRVIVVGDDGQVVRTYGGTGAQGTAPLTTRTSGGTVVSTPSPSTSPGSPPVQIIRLGDS